MAQLVAWIDATVGVTYLIAFAPAAIWAIVLVVSWIVAERTRRK